MTRISFQAASRGAIAALLVAVGDTVNEGEPLLLHDPRETDVLHDTAAEMPDLDYIRPTLSNSRKRPGRMTKGSSRAPASEQARFPHSSASRAGRWGWPQAQSRPSGRCHRRRCCRQGGTLRAVVRRLRNSGRHARSCRHAVRQTQIITTVTNARVPSFADPRTR